MNLDKRLLVILDFNGTLLHRLKKTGSERINSKPDFGVNGYKCFLRPYANKFLQRLFQMPGVEVGVWTSCQARNAQLIHARLFTESQRESLVFLWDRRYCDNAPAGIKSKNVEKNLSKVWGSRIVNMDGKWDERNTVLIDDSPSKFKKTPFNGLRIPEFDATGNSSNGVYSSPLVDSALLTTIAWIESLATTTVRFDVRQSLKEHPPFIFCPHTDKLLSVSSKYPIDGIMHSFQHTRF